VERDSDHSWSTIGEAKTIDDAKARFKEAWIAFKDKVGSEALAKALWCRDEPRRPGRSVSTVMRMYS
jgi:hypothetical protein